MALAKDLLTAFLVFAVFLPSQALAEDQVITIIIKKQEEKKRQRWSLESWLSLKHTWALQDQWLAMNTKRSSPYEFFMDGGANRFNLSETAQSNQTNVDGIESEFGFFYKIFGVQGSYVDREPGVSSWEASARLRLLGSSQQSTNFTAFYGFQENRDTVSGIQQTFQNQFFGTAMDFYLLDFLGLQAEYRHYLPNTSGTGVRQEGSEWRGGAFVELSFVRFYGQFFEQVMDRTGSLNAEKARRGLRMGLRLFF